MKELIETARGQVRSYEKLYKNVAIQLIDALEAQQAEIAELREMVQARGMGIDEISRERDALADQVKVLRGILVLIGDDTHYGCLVSDIRVQIFDTLEATGDGK